MHYNADFYTIWRKYLGNGEDDEPSLCPIARQFQNRLDDLLFSSLDESVIRGQILQAKAMLQEEWQNWKKSLPERHVRICSRNSRCLGDVYQESYDRLQLMELTYKPRVNIILDYEILASIQNPPALPKPEVVILDGTTIGEEILRSRDD